MTRTDRILQLCEGEAVLDIGCYGDRTAYGHPLWLHGQIRDVASEVVGIDINESGIEELRAAGYEVSHENAEAFDLDREFDVVVAAEVIEHLTDPAGFLESVERHLADDGLLVVTTPNLHSLFVLGAYLSPFYSEEEHSIGFTPTILGNLLERCGWTVETLTLTTHEDIPRFKNELINSLVPDRLDFTILCTARP